MDTASTPALRRIWADATPLSKFIEDRAEQLCREAPPIPRRKIPRNHQLSPLEGMALMMELNANLDTARVKALKETVNHLVAGRIVGLGRRSDSYDIEAIEGSFWIGADVGGDTASQRSKKMIDIRIVSPEAIPSIQPKAQAGPGRPSEGDVILAAISEYARTDPGLKRPPSVRYRAYRSYIASKGYDPDGAGFGVKTLEKYETEYRNENS